MAAACSHLFLFDSTVGVCHWHKHVYCVVHSVTQDQDEVKDLVSARHSGLCASSLQTHVYSGLVSSLPHPRVNKTKQHTRKRVSMKMEKESLRETRVEGERESDRCVRACVPVRV